MGVLYMATQKEILNDLYNGNININEIIPISQEYRTKMMVKESILEPILQGMIDELAGK